MSNESPIADLRSRRFAVAGAAVVLVVCALGFVWIERRMETQSPHATKASESLERRSTHSLLTGDGDGRPSVTKLGPTIRGAVVRDDAIEAAGGPVSRPVGLSFPTVAAAATTEAEPVLGPTLFPSLAQLPPMGESIPAPPLTADVPAPSSIPFTTPQAAPSPSPPSSPAYESIPSPPVTMPLEQLPIAPTLVPNSPPNPAMFAPSTLGPAVPPPPLPGAPIGRFLAHGTITPADVRGMALRNNKDIAVLGYLPQRDESLVGVEESIFDPVFNVAMQGGTYNRQVATQVQALGPPIPELRTSFWNPIAGLNQIYLEKLFVTGGKVTVGLGENYTSYSPAGSFVFVNPAYQSTLNLQLDQPLFRGRGAAATTAMVQIARANQQQSWQAFMAVVSQILRDADYAYWDLYAAFQDWEVRDTSVQQAAETLERERGKLNLGEGSVPDVAQAEELYDAFLIARTDAENRLVNAQRVLRRLMGIPPDDPRPLIPATAPSDAPIELDWSFATDEVHRRPEFAAQQAAVAAAQAEVARRRNGLLPDLSMRAIYSVSGLDNNWDQAWNTVGNWNYNDWTAGVIYRQPIGRRSDRALADRAETMLAMETARLRQLEHEILHQLNAAYQHVQNTQRLLDLHRRRREAAALQLTARRELYLENRAALRDQLDAEVRYATSLFDEANARINYQRALTEWNYARGALAEAGIMASQ